MVQANCPCGNTLALGTKSMPLAAVHSALDWIKHETERRGAGSEELLGQMRAKVREQILSELAAGDLK